MRFRMKFFLAVALLVSALLASGLASAIPQKSPQPQKSPTPQKSPQDPSSRTASSLLPDRLGSLRAAGEVRQYTADTLGEIAAGKADAFRDYQITEAASRQYGKSRVDIFKTASSFESYGLFTFTRDYALKADAEGTGWLQDGYGFWKDRLFVRVTGPDRQELPGLASAVSSLIGPAGDVSYPPAVDSLPAEPSAPRSVRYFAGPASFDSYIPGGSEIFSFGGDATAVIAEYDQAGNPRPLKLVVVEYNTPQFAYEAMGKVNEYVKSLPDEARDNTIVKREGNFVVEATDIANRDQAEQLISSIKYPYMVKWLRNPLLPTEDPFRAQKTAQMLISIFAIIGLMLLIALLGGAFFGGVIFNKRRRHSEDVFSDAGGMLRLDIDPLPGVTDSSRLLDSGDK